MTKERPLLTFENTESTGRIDDTLEGNVYRECLMKKMMVPFSAPFSLATPQG